MFFSGQGPVLVAPTNASTGVPAGFFNIGNLESFTFGFEPNVITDKESQSGNRLVAARIETELTATLEIVLKEPNIENLEMMYRATKVSVAGASAVDEINSGTGLVAGQFLITKHQDISAVTVKDSAGSPATLVLNTDYEITSAKFGRIKLLNVGAYTQPFKVSYTYASRVVLPLFNSTQKDYFLHMEGINTVDSTAFLAQFYKSRFSPPTEFNLLTDEFGRFTLSGELLVDDTRDTDANFRKFGRLVNPL